MSKKKADYRPPEDYDPAFELTQDMERSAMLLSDEARERVEQAREGLLFVLGSMSSHVPQEPTEEDIVTLTRLVATAVRFRNVIRAEFLKDMGYELPSEYDEDQGPLDLETVH